MSLAVTLAALCIPALLLSHLGVWAPRRPLVRVYAVGLALCFLPAAFLATTELLSRPKPIAWEFRAPATDAEVVAFVLREGDAIFVWVQLPGADEPRAYVLPWSERLARDLHEAQRAGQQQGRRPHIQGLDSDEPVAHLPPVQPLPPKIET